MLVDVIFEEIEEELEADFEEVKVVDTGGDPYKGDYAVTPKVGEQVLPTKDKYMVDDVTINPVPIFEVSNTSGGNTVYIAEEM